MKSRTLTLKLPSRWRVAITISRKRKDYEHGYCDYCEMPFARFTCAGCHGTGKDNDARYPSPSRDTCLRCDGRGTVWDCPKIDLYRDARPLERQPR